MMKPHHQRKRWILGLTLLVGLGLALALPALARAGQSTKDNLVPSANHIIYVAKTGDGSDGSSWAQAYTELQDALAVAESSDQIWVAKGIYYPDQGSGQSNDERANTFTLTSGVEIYGGFDPASGADQFEQRDWQAKAGYEAGRCSEVQIADAKSAALRAKLIADAKKFYQYVVQSHGEHELAAQAKKRLAALAKLMP